MKSAIQSIYGIFPGLRSKNAGQSGGALLSAVVTAGVVMAMVQSTLYYRARESSKFLGSEKNKVVAAQLAEAGVEENIADLGSRSLVVQGSMQDYVTYNQKPLQNGTYTTRLTVEGVGADADTARLVSVGTAGGKTQTVQVRMRLKDYLDTSRVPLMVSAPETTYTFNTVTVYDTAITTEIKDPSSMPALDAQPAYGACMGSSDNKCDVCHLPSGDETKANVINVSKNSVDTHIDHHGDYMTTDGTCDIYKPQEVKTITSRTEIDTVMNIAENVTYDTVETVATRTRVRILSWR